MSGKKVTNGESVDAPIFDFSRVGKKWNYAWTVSMTRASRAQLTMQRVLPEGASYEEVYQQGERAIAAMEELQQIGDDQAGLLAQVLVYVPRGWLLEDAPEEIDWSDVASLDWIRLDKYSEIFDLLRSRNARSSAKN